MAARLTIQPKPLRELLREAGAAPHARLDATFTACSGNRSGYIRLLQTLDSFHASADSLLASWVAGSAAAPTVTIPRRTTALKSDLLRLGASTRAPVDLSGLPRALDEDEGAVVLTMRTGEALTFFSDGVVERRGESIEMGLDRLRRPMEADEAHASDAVSAVRRLVAAAQPQRSEDDTTLMLLVRDSTDDA